MKSSFVIVLIVMVYVTSPQIALAEVSQDELADMQKTVHSMTKLYGTTKNLTTLDSEIRHADRKTAQLALKVLVDAERNQLPPTFGEGKIVWREFPHNVTDDERVNFQLTSTTSIVINYRRVVVRTNVVVYFCENSFHNPRKYGGRINPSMYVVQITGTHPSLLFFREPYSGPGCQRSGGLSPSFLGTIDKGNEMPQVALLYGPSGSGRFASIYVFTFASATGVWEPERVLEMVGVGSYDYDEKGQVLIYQEKDEGVWKGKSFHIALDL